MAEMFCIVASNCHCASWLICAGVLTRVTRQRHRSRAADPRDNPLHWFSIVSSREDGGPCPQTVC